MASKAVSLLILGDDFTIEERERLDQAYPSTFLSKPDDIAGLDPKIMSEIQAIAFKGHKPLSENHFELLPSLGLVANFGVGYDAIDVDAASARSVHVTNTPDVLNDDVADLAIGLMIAQARTMRQGEAHVRDGLWPKVGELPLNRKVSGTKAGILGLGRIGREIALRLEAFKMDIHYHSRAEKETPGWTFHADRVSLAREVEFLFVALVGGKATEGYVTGEVIEALGPKGVLINISRGSTVDEAALLDALETGRIAGAGLDVYLGEPEIDPRFFVLDNVALQPHQGSGTVETRRAMALLQLENIEAFMSGEPLITPVN